LEEDRNRLIEEAEVLTDNWAAAAETNPRPLELSTALQVLLSEHQELCEQIIEIIDAGDQRSLGNRLARTNARDLADTCRDKRTRIIVARQIPQCAASTTRSLCIKLECVLIDAPGVFLFCALTYEADRALRVAEVGDDRGGARIRRVCDRRYSFAAGTGLASCRMGARRKQRTGRPRRHYRLNN